MKALRRNEERMRSSGFTLIELMVTIVVATILLGIAIPSYQYEMRKSRRTEAKNTLLDAAAREERYYATQNAYTADTGQLQYTTGSGSFPYVSGTYYQIEQIYITAPTASTTGVTLGGFAVVVSPAPGSPQSADTPCQSFIVDQTGNTWSTNAPNDNPASPTGAITTSTCWP